MPFSERQKKIVKTICEMARPYFEITDDPYPGATQYREGDGGRNSPKIQREANDEIQEFGLEQNREPNGTNLKIDWWDGEESICYELCLGQGQEVYKDLFKAMIMKAEGLIVICREYPDPTEQGYKTILRRLKVIQNTNIWNGKIGVVDLMNPNYTWIDE